MTRAQAAEKVAEALRRLINEPEQTTETRAVGDDWQDFPAGMICVHCGNDAGAAADIEHDADCSYVAAHAALTAYEASAGQGTPIPAAQVVEAARVAKHPCRECALGACQGSRPDAPYLECDGDAGGGERCPCKCNNGGRP